MPDDKTRLVAAPTRHDDITKVRPLPRPRQQELYGLQPGDLNRLGPFLCIHRLKPGAEPIYDDKPTPLLGIVTGRTRD